MDIQVIKGEILEQQADLLVLGVHEFSEEQGPVFKRLSNDLQEKLQIHLESNEFEGKSGQQVLLPAPDAIHAAYVLIVGLGNKKDGLASTVRQIAGSVMKTAKSLGLSSVALELFGEDAKEYDAKTIARNLVESLLIADYDFSRYKEAEKKKVVIGPITICTTESKHVRLANGVLDDTRSIVDGVNIARDLVNTPAGDMNPAHLAEAAHDIAKQSNNISIKVLGKKECEKLGMGSYLSVAEGSDAPPQFIHLTYTPNKKAKKVVALVGKGVTFDSGGLSIKPSNGMMTMKCDMAGSAAVLGAFATLDQLQPALEVHGIIAATENMINGKATRPGDVVTASNGKTIEILNTDAEGRLTLADALHYAAQLDPDYTIDLATLTGACAVALGEEISAAMGNDDAFMKKVLSAAELADEGMWPMPLPSSYEKLLKSDIADIRNISRTRYGGSLTAGLFLQNFVADDMKWVHLDIAGPAFAERPIGTYIQKGGTGFGVRTLAYFLKSL